MAEAATAVAAATGLPNHGGGGGGGSNPGSGTSTPGSRFRVDATDSRKNSGGSAAGLGGPLLPVNGETPPAVAPPPYAPSGGDCLSASAASAEMDTNGTKTASTELLSPGSREGELSVPIIALPDGELVRGSRSTRARPPAAT